MIGGDCNSRVINPGDQKSFPLFGDGAGAVLLAPGEHDQGLVAYQLGSDGSGGDLLSRPACGSRIPPSAAVLEKGLHYLTMDGRAVFKWAVRILADSALAVLAHADCQVAGDPLVHPAPGERAHHPRRQRRARVSTATPSSRTSSVTATPRPARSRSPSTSSIAKASIERGDLLLTSGFGAGLELGHGALALVSACLRGPGALRQPPIL